MASFVYTNAKKLIAQGALNFTEGQVDLRVALVMTNTTADTEDDTEFISGFTTLDEMGGANYARKVCANQAIAQDDPNLRAEITFDAITWTALGAGTRQVQGAILFKFVTDDTDSIPIAWVDTGGFPFTANGGNVTLTPNAEGFLQVT